MKVSARVDVVIADETPIQPPPTRVIVIAPTKEAGQDAVSNMTDAVEVVAIVTPRSPHAARGTLADEIIEVEGLTDEQLEALRDEAAPALATTQEK
ncbi:hypothetical protein EV140_1935 [Microcella alkaliphila]|uniref:Uncharacterized protein n=1 Tax=Microcella alkaliphila TaxID=279828 RepID=A0A4Q7TI10_9MICO|nr:hypothetical protein [Microcella alkaliphila]RZT59330.1 hypothetical protein EV140_1935 [Microcella alkaliphila]